MVKQNPPPILEFRQVGKAFPKSSGDALAILKDIDLSIADGEILGLLGRSGSGKSTLLRIAGGLVEPSSGQVSYQGIPLTGPAPGIAIVFQSFALYPWLTVSDNIAFGLDALGLPEREARERTIRAIDLVGLDGFQSAYPRELSGGMRQRVGFARAIVGDPVLLLMDEPFSALDVLTSETLRTEFLDLWDGHKLSTKAVLMVTHNIEEAVLMCDRILVLGSNPGHIAAEIPVSLPQPRSRLDAGFHAVVDEIYAILTARMTQAISAQGQIQGGLAQHLRPVSTNRLVGFVEALMLPPYQGKADLAKIAHSLRLHINDLFPIAAALHILEFATATDGAIELTAAGRLFAEADMEGRKRLFREHLIHFVPLAVHIRQILDERAGHRAPLARFELELQDHLNKDDADNTLRTVIGWGRYAELFLYDEPARMFSSRTAK